jgi:type I restriction enzyme, S subunit
MNELPPGWANACLADLGAWSGGGTPSKSRSEFWSNGSIPWVSPKDMKVNLIADAEDHITEAAVKGSATNVVPAGSVLVVVRSGILRRTLPVAVTTSAVALNQDLKALKPAEGIDPRYLAWFLRGNEQWILHECAKDGTTVDSIDFPALLRLVTPVAPPAEQVRIVAAIEEQFSRLDAGVAALERARQNLKRMRDLLPLLLLGRDRCAAPDEDSEFGSRHVDGNSYQWAQLAEVSEQIVDCPHSTPTFLSQGMACIDTTCISPGVIHRDRLRYVDPSTYRDRVRRLMPQHGDLIFAREGTVGTAVVVPRDMHPCLGQRVMLFRPDPSTVDSDYMCLVVNSEIVKRQYRSMLLGTTVPHLNVRDAKALRIPLPSLQVQRAIATEADRIGSVLSAVETAVELNETLSSSLRSSILTAAFSGKLVPQDSDDEAASVLLEQIAAERASSNGRKPASSRKPRTPCEKVVI